MEPARFEDGAYPEGKAHIQSFEEKNIRCLTVRTVPETGKTGASGRGNDSGLSVFRGKTRAELLGEILTAQGADAEVSLIRAAMDEIYNIRPE